VPSSPTCGPQELRRAGRGSIAAGGSWKEFVEGYPGCTSTAGSAYTDGRGPSNQAKGPSGGRRRLFTEFSSSGAGAVTRGLAGAARCCWSRPGPPLRSTARRVANTLRRDSRPLPRADTDAARIRPARDTLPRYRGARTPRRFRRAAAARTRYNVQDADSARTLERPDAVGLLCAHPGRLTSARGRASTAPGDRILRGRGGGGYRSLLGRRAVPAARRDSVFSTGPHPARAARAHRRDRAARLTSASIVTLRQRLYGRVASRRGHRRSETANYAAPLAPLALRTRLSAGRDYNNNDGIEGSLEHGVQLGGPLAQSRVRPSALRSPYQTLSSRWHRSRGPRHGAATTRDGNSSRRWGCQPVTDPSDCGASVSSRFGTKAPKRGARLRTRP